MLPVNRWIIGEVADTVAAMETAFAAYRFDEAANAIYSFAWDRFCDWYLELIKGNIDDETRVVAGWVLDQILVMLHPFMPFITEELWTGLGERADYPLITAKWPAPNAARDADASADIDWLIKLVSELRAAKAELGLPPGARLTAHFRRRSTLAPTSSRHSSTALRASKPSASTLPPQALRRSSSSKARRSRFRLKA